MSTIITFSHIGQFYSHIIISLSFQNVHFVWFCCSMPHLILVSLQRLIQSSIAVRTLQFVIPMLFNIKVFIQEHMSIELGNNILFWKIGNYIISTVNSFYKDHSGQSKSVFITSGPYMQHNVDLLI